MNSFLGENIVRISFADAFLFTSILLFISLSTCIFLQRCSFFQLFNCCSKQEKRKNNFNFSKQIKQYYHKSYTRRLTNHKSYSTGNIIQGNNSSIKITNVSYNFEQQSRTIFRTSQRMNSNIHSDYNEVLMQLKAYRFDTDLISRISNTSGVFKHICAINRKLKNINSSVFIMGSWFNNIYNDNRLLILLSRIDCHRMEIESYSPLSGYIEAYDDTEICSYLRFCISLYINKNQ